MDIKDLSKQLDAFHAENKQDHTDIKQKMERVVEKVEGNTRDLLVRPTFAESKIIAKESNGFKHWLASGIGAIIGAVSGFFSAYFLGSK